MISLKIQKQDETFKFNIPLPFTINKFIEYLDYDESHVNYVLNNIPNIFREIDSKKLKLDREILINWNQLEDVFRKIKKIEENSYLLSLNFGSNNLALIIFTFEGEYLEMVMIA